MPCGLCQPYEMDESILFKGFLVFVFIFIYFMEIPVYKQRRPCSDAAF